MVLPLVEPIQAQHMPNLPTIGSRCDGHDNNFNLIRLVAALGVIVSHAYPIAGGYSAIEPFTQILNGKTLGNICVQVFFAISGFFIVRSFARRSSTISFVSARALRIFPALAVVLIVTLLVCAAFTTVSPAEYWKAAPDYFVRNFTLVSIRYDLPGVFVGNPYGNGLNSSLWSLEYEMYCYLAVLVFGVFGLIERPVRCAAALGGFFIAYALSTILGGKFLMLIVGFPFIIGAAFWIWRNSIPLSFPVVIAGLVLAAMSRSTPLFFPMLDLALAYAVFYVGFAKKLIAPAYDRIGDLSYGTYIYAFPIQQMLAHFGTPSPLANMALAIPLTLGCAALSWHMVERPALGLKQRIFARPSGAISGA